MQLASDEPFVPSLPKTGSAIGIDLNLKNFYVDSNGRCVNHPVYIQRTKRRVTRAQRILSRKVRGCRRNQITLTRS